MKLLEDYSLKTKNTFGIDSIAKYFVSLSNINDLEQLLPYTTQGKYLILGGGSNIVLPDYYDGLVIENNITGFTIEHSNSDFTLVRVGAGENWHSFVEQLISSGVFGFENLALIPGKVGAAPIQNIGAYGVEQNKFFLKAEVFNLQSGEFSELNIEQCNFGYRTSIFKQTSHNYLVTSVYYKFPKKWTPTIDYKDIKDRISSEPNYEITPYNIFNLICEIRSNKLPDPKVFGNAGSFFKNPVISEKKYHNVIRNFPELSGFRDGENYKLSAAKLIENAGWKGKKLAPNSNISVSSQHSLVIINHGDGTYSDIIDLSQAIIEDVADKYGVLLEREVNIIK